MKWTIAALILLMSGSPGVAMAEDSTQASIGDSRLTAGDVVVLEEPIDGNAFAAGSRVELRERVDRSAFLSGANVTMAGSVGRNLYAAGGEVRIEGEVKGKARAAGGKIRLSSEARIGGSAAFAGESIDVDGAVGGRLRAYGDTIVINGSVGGDVEVAGSGTPGLLTVTTVSGDARLTNLAGEVNGNTVSGDVTIAMGEASRSRLRSTSGNLGLKGRLAADARLDVESISGDVRLDLEGPIGAEFDVSSFNGDIRNCFGPKPVRTSEYAPGSEWRFREGAGAARVRIKTLNGDINICNK